MLQKLISRLVSVFALLFLVSGCSSLRGVQQETCQTIADIAVPLFCPVEEEEEDG